MIMSSTSSSKTDDRATQVAQELETVSQGRLTAVSTTTEGIQVHASLSLSKGTLLVECPAIRIALDPSRWTTHCGFCANNAPITSICAECQVIGICSDCSLMKTTNHSKECNALRNFLELLQSPSSDLRPIDVTSHLLTIRLLGLIQETSDSTIGNQNHPNKIHDWYTLVPQLYGSSIPSDELHNSKRIVSRCWKTHPSSHNDVAFIPSVQDLYETIFSRVLGCSHAVTDLALPLGNQLLGRALFWHHSFYNHACAPNAYLSCSGHIARVHLLQSVIPGDSITLSYIPLSGLSRQERQDRLQCNYGFECDCTTCCSSSSMHLPPGADVDSIREVQYSCNERLLVASQSQQKEDEEMEQQREEEIENILSLVRMTQRGIQTQGIPVMQEVALEAHRLLAMGLSLLGRSQEAIMHHRAWFQHGVVALMDPTAVATQRLALARDLAAQHSQESHQEWKIAIQELTESIGDNHPWIKSLQEEYSQRRATKRQRCEELEEDNK